MPKKRSWSDEDLIAVVAKSDSLRQVCRELNIAESGSGYINVKRHINRLKLNTEHFIKHKMPKVREHKLEDILSNKVYCYSNKLKQKLIKAGVFEEKCYQCNSTEWQGVKIPLELEHIDGNSRNNILENLTLLCPNCHALTPTYRGRNIGNNHAGKTR